MAWVTMAIRLIPFVIKMVGIVEKLFDDVPDSGADKKQFVMTAVEGIFGVVLGISSGGQAETWAKLEPVISSVIDAVCDAIFPHEEEIDG
ncbi:MAG: hypothetical protein HN929_14235 [Chloroflexi bacterium]|jgi:hypothetical protein|nr:hypothetical protein [Chloroflexota bacterium]